MVAEFKAAYRLDDLPGYPFAELERKAAQFRAEEKALYDLSIGDPDLEPADFIKDAIRESVNNPKSHYYPSSVGDLEVRKTIAKWYENRFGVEIDPTEQVCLVIGGKEGLSQMARAVVNPGDIVAVPDPAYPVYGRAGCQLLDAKLRTLKLNAENGFLPNLEEARGAKLVYLNYPNNPTGAVASDEFMKSAADLADSDPSNTIVYDLAYSEMCFEYQVSSLLELTPNVIEFHSLSKIANATGYRVGFAIGEPRRISALRRIKEEMDSGVPYPFQRALQATLEAYDGATPPKEILNSIRIYERRRNKIIQAIESYRADVFRTPATFYIWFKVGSDEMEFINLALDKGLLLTPGRGFGEEGRGWVRASITASDEVVDHAIEIIRSL